MRYKILESKQFEKDIQKHRIPRIIIVSLRRRLKENPKIGRSLKYPFFREVRHEGKRIYFLVYEEKMAVYLIGVSDKKAQQMTIRTIVEKMDYYTEELNKLVN
ncbi:hypothetical protein ACFL1B_01465 [Nanoarchaeota archaeon]